MSQEPKSETAAKIENCSVIKDPNEGESKELVSIYSASKIPTGTQKRTYSAQCGSSKLTLQEQNNSPMMNSCNCKPMPLYYSCPRNSGAPTQCASNAHHRYATMPLPGHPCSPNDDFDDLWNLQFCRWWGWNWIRKREEEMMNKQKESSEIQRKRRGLHHKRSRSRSGSKTRKKPPKKDDFFTWCRRLCRGGQKQNQLKPTEKEQLKQLYATPCSSITSPGGLKDLENQSLHFVGEYGCSCSDARQICTPVTIMPCRTRRQECKYNIRKHQSWVCEKTESSSSDECCQHISACPRRSSNSTTEESIEYLTLRMECIMSDCEDDREYECRKLTPINGGAKSPRCSCEIEQNCVCGGCQQKTSPIKCKKPPPCCTCGSCQQKKFRIKCKKPSACCTCRECEQSPCKCSSTVRIPRLRKCLPPCKRQQCYKLVHPCEYQTPKCFPRRVKQPKCYCCQKRKEYIIYCPCQVQCKKKCRCRQSNRLACKDFVCKETDKPENKLVATSSNTSKGDDVGTDKIKNEKLKQDHRGTPDKCVDGPSNDTNTPLETRNCNGNCNNCNCNRQHLHKCPYTITYLDNNTSGDTCLRDGYICNFMQDNISKGIEAGVYASPATGRMYSLNPKILTARSVSHKSHLPGPINVNETTLAYNNPIQLPQIDEEHKLLLTAVCEAILSSRASSKESDLEVNRDCYSIPESPVSSYDDDDISKNFPLYKNMKTADSYKPLNHDHFLSGQNSDKAVFNNWTNRNMENRNETEFNIASKLPPNNQNMFDSYYSRNITSTNFLPLSSNVLESFSGKDAIKHKQNNMIHSILQKISCPEEPNQQHKKNVLFHNTLPQQMPPTENNLSRDNISGKKLTEKLISAVDSCALLKSWRKDKTTKPVQNSRGSINTPKSIFSHCSPICKSLEMSAKTLIGLHNRYSNLTKPENTFLNASCDLPQNLMNTSKFPSIYMSAAKSPAKEVTEEYRYKKDLLEESDKTQHYNVFFSTVHTNIGDDISNFSHNSRSVLPPSEYPLAVLEELPPSSINEQTQTSNFLLKAPVLICEDSPERKLRCINLNEKYSFLTDQTQVSTSKQIESKNRNNNVAAANAYFLKESNDGLLPFPNSTTSKSGSVYDVENNRPLFQNILKLSENALDNKIKYNHSENELICFNLNQRDVCPYASLAKTSRSKATCGAKNKQLLPQSTLVPSKEYKSSTITYQLENQIPSVLPNSLYSSGASVEIGTTPTTTSGTNEQYLENDILEDRSEENNTVGNGVQRSSINNEENFYPDNALTTNFTTKDSSDKQSTKEDMLPYDHLESELLCLNLNEASNDLCRYDVSWMPHSESLNNVKPRQAHSQAELQSHSVPQNMNVVNFSDTENIVAIINRRSKEYLNDLGFITKHLQSYSSISDTSSIKSKLNKSHVDKCILCQPVPYTREVQYSSSDFTIDSSTSLPDIPIQPQPQETVLVNSSTSPFRFPFEPEVVVKPYVDSATSPFKFEYVKMRAKDKEPMPIDNTRRKIMKRESAFSMFCLPVLSKEAVGLSTQDSNISLSRPERKIVVDKPKRLNIREKRWPF